MRATCQRDAVIHREVQTRTEACVTYARKVPGVQERVREGQPVDVFTEAIC